MIELSDSEAKAIVSVVQRVQQKHMDGSEITADKLTRLANELQGRINDLGFETTVDVSPLLVGDSPTVRIDAKVDAVEQSLGVEKKMYEVRKRAERHDPVPNIEGHV